MVSSAKPLRLRTACTECYGAKVRCSGERDGCTRCKRRNLKCEYRVSMVGRAPKRRVGRACTGLNEDHSCLAGEEESQLDGETISSCFSPNMGQSPEEDVLMGGGINGQMGMASANGGPCLHADHEHVPFSVFLGGLDPSLLPGHMPSDLQSTTGMAPDLNMASSLPDGLIPWNLTPLPAEVAPSNASTTSGSTLQSSLASRTSERVPDIFRDKSVSVLFPKIVPHTAKLMELIETLESVVQLMGDEQDDRLSVDEAIRQMRTAMKEVSIIVEMKNYQRCNSCGGLAATVLDLVGSIYELVGVAWGLWASRDDEGRQCHDKEEGLEGTPTDTDVAASGGSGGAEQNEIDTPLFSFGSLELEPDEQTFFRKHLMGRDLKVYTKTVQHCALINSNLRAAGGPLSFDVPGRTGKNTINTFSFTVQAQWYDEMEQNAQRLLESL